MERMMKRLLVNAVPTALCAGAATTLARGDRIQWADSDRSQPPKAVAASGQNEKCSAPIRLNFRARCRSQY